MDSAHIENFKELIREQKRGNPKGIYSICSYNKYAVEAAFQQAIEDFGFVLIESTCNQVNQYGGYTGMTPFSFRDYIYSIVRAMDFPPDKIILGGDHLGPFPFKNEQAADAMRKALDMVKAYVHAGCMKIHIDTSMRLADDAGGASGVLDPRVVAERCTELCAASEAAFHEIEKRKSGVRGPVYVIGTDVPAPGGSDEVEQGLKITTVSDFEETVSITKEAFVKRSLQGAWERVIAVVVQPGVEHGDHTVIEYDSGKAGHLVNAIKKYQNLVFEGHATDYQTVECLKKMVEDGIAVLKVGPSLTFAAREAVFLLNYVEEEIYGGDGSASLSRFIETLDGVMQESPGHWKNHYGGTEREIAFARKYSFFDRARYYWGDLRVIKSLERLMQNLRAAGIPLSLISQFFPGQYRKIRMGLLDGDPEAIIRDRVKDVIKLYAYAVGNTGRP